MNWPRLVRPRWLGLLRQQRFESEMEEELRFHLALGAPKSAILQLILGESAALIFYSVALGSVWSWLTLWRLGSFLHPSLGNTFPITAFVALLVSGVALIACWLPARRAASEDPLAAIGLR